MSSTESNFTLRAVDGRRGRMTNAEATAWVREINGKIAELDRQRAALVGERLHAYEEQRRSVSEDRL